MGSCQSSIPSYDDLSRFGGPSSICLQCGKPSRDRAVVRTHGQDHPDGIEGSGVAGDAGKPLPEFNRCRELARNGIMPALDATRKMYNPLTGSYDWRTAVRAVLVSIWDE